MKKEPEEVNQKFRTFRKKLSQRSLCITISDEAPTASHRASPNGTASSPKATAASPKAIPKAPSAMLAASPDINAESLQSDASATSPQAFAASPSAPLATSPGEPMDIEEGQEEIVDPMSNLTQQLEEAADQDYNV